MNFRYIFYITLVISLSAQTQVVVKEVMFIDAPYVGEVTTTTSKYAAAGLFRQEASIEVDRFLIRLAMGGNKSLGSILNGKSESRIVYNAKDEEYAMETFDTIRVNDGIPTLKATTGRMNMGGGSGGGRGNDNSDEEEEKAEFDRTISKLLERMPGFDARKVTTKIKGKNGIILVEEWFTTDTTLLQFVSEVEADLVASYGGQKTSISEFIPLAESNVPPNKPPPLTGQTIISRLGSSSINSLAHVPCPATMRSSLYG